LNQVRRQLSTLRCYGLFLLKKQGIVCFFENLQNRVFEFSELSQFFDVFLVLFYDVAEIFALAEKHFLYLQKFRKINEKQADLIFFIYCLLDILQNFLVDSLFLI
jgi:hypothetical protein